MKRFLLILAIALSLGGCVTQKAVMDQTKLVAVTPPVTLYQCPVLDKFPVADKLTNKQVAKTIETLYRNNQICSINMKKIEEYVNKAKESISNDVDGG